MLASEQVLARDWNQPDEDKAWEHLSERVQPKSMSIKTWNDFEGKFSVDVDARTWSFEGSGWIHVPTGGKTSVLQPRYFPSCSGMIMHVYEFSGQTIFYGLVQTYDGKPINRVQLPAIQGGFNDTQGNVAIHVSSPAIAVAGQLEGDLSGAEAGGSNQGN